MSFTQEELQSFHSVLEQRFQAHQQEVEQAFDQRIAVFRRYSEQRLDAMQQEILRVMSSKLSEFQGQIEAFLSEKLNAWQQALASREEMHNAGLLNGHQQLEAIEVQTELPWEDLAHVIGQTLDERLASFKEETHRLLNQQEQQIATHLNGIQHELAGKDLQPQEPQGESPVLEGLLQGIEHLERVIESLQVVMTANHALLSDRLYSHQQQPIERAHLAGHLRAHTPVERVTTDESYANSPME